jgi:hypothetical protein
MLKFTLMILVGILFTSLTNKNKKRLTPPGTKYIKQLGYYVDKKELSIEDWREFYFYTKNKVGDSAAKLCLPDTAAITRYYGRSVYYSTNKKDENLPIVGVTISQIEQYCKFRSEAVRTGDKFKNTTVTYYPLDSAMFMFLSVSSTKKGIEKVSSKVAEAITYNGVYKVTENGVLTNYLDFKNHHGFRCIAKYE